MASPGGKNVGRISIKVLPDTDSFAAELKAKLQELEKKLHIKIPVELDTGKVAAENAAMRAEVKKPISVPVQLDRHASKAGEAIGAGVNLGKFAKVLSKVLEVNAALKRAAVSTKNVAKAAVNVKNHWNATLNSVKKFGKAVKTVATQNPLKTLWHATTRVSSGFAKAGRGVKKFSGLLSGGIGKAIGKTIKPLGKLAQGLKSVDNKFGNFSRAGLIAIAVTGLLAPALGVIATLMAGLPSLIAAGGAAFAAIKLGMDGIKKAAAPLKASLQGIKAQLSATFQKGLTPVFQQLNKIMPVLGTGLNKVAQGLIPLAQAFTNVVTSAKGMQQIQNILAKVGQFFTALQPMITQGTQAFLTLANAGANSFGLLSGVLNKFATGFNQMVQQMTSNGTFAAAMKGLSQVLGSLLSLFTTLFAEGMKAMAQLGGPLSNAINAIKGAFVAMMPTLTQIAKYLLNGIAGAMKIITPLFQKFGGIIAPIGAALIALLPAVKVFGILSTAIKGVIAVMKLLKLAFLSNPFTALIAAVLALAIIIYTNWDAIKGYLLTAWNWIKNTAISVWNAIKGFFVNLFVSISSFFISIWTSITSFLSGVWNGIVAIGISVWTSISSFFSAMWTAMLALITSIWNGIVSFLSGIWNGIKNTATNIWNGITNGISSAVNAVKNFIVNGFNKVVGFFGGLAGKILSAIGNIGSRLLSVGRNIIEGIWNGITGAAKWLWNKISGFVGSIVSHIKGFLGIGSPSKVMRDEVGHWIPAGVAVGINNNMAAATKAAQGLASNVVAATRNGTYQDAGYQAGASLADGWVQGMEKVLKSIGPGLAPFLNKTVQVKYGSVSQDTWDNLLGMGYRGNPTDHAEALYVPVRDGVIAALEGTKFKVDGQGMAKLVNETNQKNSRR